MKVAIAGYGQEGEASLLYWRALGAGVTVFDERVPERQVPDGVETYFGEDVFSQMNGFDLVIRTPALRPDKITTDGKIWSATNEFFAKCPVPIIGVTGTKGKGTTSTLVSRILEEAGFKTWLVGNIGVPALDVLEEINTHESRVMSQEEKTESAHTSYLMPHISDNNAVVVFELSSFQLWDLEKSPETAVVLMIEPDHMDVHTSMEEYVSAKANITAHQSEGDVVIYLPTNRCSAEIAAESAGKKIQYMSTEGARIEDDSIIVKETVICKTNEVGLIGAHNLENICAAITAAWQYTQDQVSIKKMVTSFKGLSHRLELAGEVDGVRFYNDSQATGVGSTLAAIRSFGEPTVLILGGSDKGVDISPVIKELDPRRHSVVLIGQVSGKLEDLLKQRSFNAYVKLGMDTNMTEIISEAQKLSKPGGVVLLSPAHASFGMFKNYQDRGDQFKAVVSTL